MKILAVVLFFLLQVTAGVLAKWITCTKRKVPIIQVFEEIRQQTGYRMIWNKNNAFP